MSDIDIIEGAVAAPADPAPAPPGLESGSQGPPPPAPEPGAAGPDSVMAPPPPPPPPPSDDLPPEIDDVQSPVQEPVASGSVIPPGQPGSEAPSAGTPTFQAEESVSCAEACAGVEEVIADLPPDLPPVPDFLPPETEAAFDELPPETEATFDELPPETEATFDELPPETFDELPPETEPTFDELPPETEPTFDELPPETEPVSDELPPQTEPDFDELPPDAGGDPSMVIPPGQPGSDSESDGFVDLDPDALASCAAEMREVCSGYEQVAADIAAEPGAVGAELLEELRRTLQMLVEELSLDAADLEQRGSVVGEPQSPAAWLPSTVQAVPPSITEPSSSGEAPMRSPGLEELSSAGPAAQPVDLEEFGASSQDAGMSTLDAIALGSFVANGQGRGTYTPSSIV